MIEKIKYHLSNAFCGKQMRLKAAAFLTALTVAVVTLLNCSIHTIKIFDGHRTYTVRSLNNNVAMVMKNVDLKSDDYEIVETTRSKQVTSVEISYGFPVYITQGDKTIDIDFFGGTVEDALKAANITPDEFDFTEPALNTEITETVYIDYTDIDYIESTVTEAIPYKTDKVYSSSLKKGVSKTVKEGANGEKQVTYIEKLVNGVSVEKKATDTVVLSKAVNKKVTVGTKITSSKSVKTSNDVKCISTLTPKKAIELDKNGVPVKYKSKMTVRATAYTYTGNNCSTGVAPQPGYIAVNPKVIPYGTEMYIKTVDGKYIYGYAVAADTGGFIKKYPTGIDLFLSSESACQSFGVRMAEIYILN